MRFTMPSLQNIFPRWSRLSNSEMWSFVKDSNDWNGSVWKNNLDIAQNHPILTPAMQFVSKIFSQSEFWMEDRSTGERIYSHETLNLLNSPNFYQTKSDFLETLMFTMIGSGKAVGWVRKPIGFDSPESIYLLNPYLIEYPEEFKTNLAVSNDSNSIRNKKIIYDRDGENHSIPIKDLLFFYDLPNGLNTKNMFENASRLDGLKQTLINTTDSLKAKNIILKTNGKELITGKNGGLQLTNDEKKKAEALFNHKYGLSSTRSRSLITKADITWKSLHIAVRDLGLDESVKVDGNLIYTALHIPKDILSLEAKKTTYNNFKESMVSYIQNEMQSSVDAFCDVMNKVSRDNRYVLRGGFEHLPIMQYILKERYENKKLQGEALQTYLDAGIPDAIALKMVGMDETIVLKKPDPVLIQDTNESESEDKWKPKKLKAI